MLRPIAITPRVTTKAGRPNRAIRIPEKRPMVMPPITARAMANGMGRCSRPRPNRTPVQPAMDPTERSIPPIRITNVIPIATMPTTTDWSRTFSRLLDVRKWGDKMESATPRARASASIRISRRATKFLTNERSAMALAFIRQLSLRLDNPLDETLDSVAKVLRRRPRGIAVKSDSNPTHVVAASAPDRKQKRHKLIFRFYHKLL